MAANAGFKGDQDKLKELKIHPSETAWIGTPFDATIGNNGTIEQLYSEVKNLVQ
jgi:hypothetical protein